MADRGCLEGYSMVELTLGTFATERDKLWPMVVLPRGFMNQLLATGGNLGEPAELTSH